MNAPRLILVIIILSFVSFPIGCYSQEASGIPTGLGLDTVLFEEGFESGGGDWIIENGIWAIGTPSGDCPASFEGANCAGTILDGDYPAYTNSRLISPPLTLPAISGNEEIRLQYWQWYEYGSYTEGTVQVSEWIGGEWSNWLPVGSTTKSDRTSVDWHFVALDLTAYTGRQIRLAFHHDGSSSVRAGWYIDRVEIRFGAPEWPEVEGFENGWNDWYTDAGIWEVGQPTYNPDRAVEGVQCAGTAMDREYAPEIASRLISPTVVLPPVSSLGNIWFHYWEWYEYPSTGSGSVQISEWMENAWGEWTTVRSIKGKSDWAHTGVELTSYAGKKIRLAFLHNSSRYTDSGWFIDRVSLNQDPGTPSIAAHYPFGEVSETVHEIRLYFSHSMDLLSFSPEEDVIDVVGPRGAIAITGYTWIDDRTLAIAIESQSDFGTYEMIAGPTILNSSGVAIDQNGDKTPGQIPDDYYTASFTIVPGLFFSQHDIDLTYEGGTNLDVGDFDGDIDLDLIASSRRSGIALWSNDGYGHFTDRVTVGFFEDAFSIAGADMDGDGDLDIIAGSKKEDQIAWWENDGSSFFAKHPIDRMADGPFSACASDLDRDGDLDIAAALNDDDEIAWWENIDIGVYDKHTVETSFDEARWIHPADLNGDGLPDLLAAAFRDDELAWFQNTGGGTFGEKQTIENDIDGPETVHAADLDGDGDLDVLAAAWNEGEIAWWENDGEGNFGSKRLIADKMNNARGLDTADLDEDGDLDVLATAAEMDTVAWFENRGGGVFRKHLLDEAFDGAASIRAADLNGDGHLDIVAMGDSGDRVAWWRNELASAPRVVETIPAPGQAVQNLNEIRIQFSEVIDPSSLNPDTLLISTPGSDGKLGTNDDAQILPDSIEYDRPSLTASLRRTAGFPEDFYRLTITDAIVDFMDNHLDGENNNTPDSSRFIPSGDGVPGGDYIYDFIVDQSSPWISTLSSSSHETMEWSGDPSIDILWENAGDSLSGVSGYWYAWSTRENTDPVDHHYINASQISISSPDLGDGEEHWFHLSAVDWAGNRSETQRLGPFYIETGPPRILKSSPYNKECLSQSPNQITIEFFDNDVDKDTITAHAFSLIASGGDGVFDNGNEITIPENDGFINYNNETRILTFIPKGDMPPDRYRLTVSDSIRDHHGNALDGNADGIPGGDYTADFWVGFTSISGSIRTQTTWEGPYLIKKTVIVEEGAALTILPGSILKFSGNTSLTVRGTLSIEGAIDKPVILTSLVDDSVGGDTNQDGDGSAPVAGDWQGVRFNNSEARGYLQNVDIRYADRAVTGTAEGARFEIENAKLTHNNNAVYVYQPYVEIIAENCLIADNRLSGVFVRADSREVFRNCTIVGNAFEGSNRDVAGIHVGGANLTIDNCIVAFNANGLHHEGDPPLLTIRNCDFFNPDGDEILWEENEQDVPNIYSNGNSIKNPRFIDRESGNYQLYADSPAIDSGRGIDAPSYDLLGQPRFDDPGVANTGAGYPSFVDRGVFERTAPGVSANLTVISLTDPSPIIVQPGATFSISWTVENTGQADLEGQWQDSIFLSSDPFIDLNEDSLLGRVTQQGLFKPGDQYTGNWSGSVPLDVAGPQFVLVFVNQRQQVIESDFVDNVLSSHAPLSVNVPVLTPDTPVISSVAPGEWMFCRFDGMPGVSIRIKLAADAATGALSLYSRLGTSPNLIQYDALSATPGQTNQEILIHPIEGTYYIGVYGQYLPGGASSITLSAEIAAFDIFTVSPNRVGQNGQATIEIIGSNFSPSDQIHLIAHEGVSELAPLNVYCPDPATLFTTFDFSGAPAGLYDLMVESTIYGALMKQEILTVTSGVAPKLEVNLIAPDIVRPGRLVDVQVECANTGETDLACPLLILVCSEEAEWLLPETGQWIKSRSYGIAPGCQSEPIAILRPGERETIHVSMRTLFSPEDVTVSLYSMYFPDNWSPLSIPINWDEIKTFVQPEDAVPESWEPIWNQLISQVGDTWGGFLQMLALHATLLPPEAGDFKRFLDLIELEIEKSTAAISASISGALRSADSEMDLSGRFITFFNIDTEEMFGAYSLNDGSFVVGDLTPGAYVLDVEGTIVLSGQNVQITDMETIVGHELYLDAGGALSGRILSSETGVPVPSARVEARSVDNQSFLTLTDETGAFDFNGLPVGLYEIIVESDGLSRFIQTDVSVKREGLVLDLNLTQNPESRIQGIVNLQGESAEESVLVVYAQSSDESGDREYFYAEIEDISFVIKNLPTGFYDVMILRYGYLPVEISGIDVSEGESIDLGTVDLSLPASVSGTIIVSASNETAYPFIVGVFEGENQVWGAFAEDDNSFLLEYLAPGTYTLRVVNLLNSYSSETEVNVSSGENLTGISLQILPGGTISGVVRDSVTGEPIAGLPVLLIHENGHLFSRFTDGAGSYRFDFLDLGEYRLTLPIGGENASSLVTVDSLDGLEQTADFEISFTTTLEGHTLTAAGEPLTDVGVMLYESGKYIVGAKSDENGNYRFRLLRGGTFDLVAQKEGAAFNSVKNVIVNDGETVTRDLIAGTASLQVKLIDSLSSVEGATVMLFNESSNEPLLAGIAEAGPDGIILFENLITGDYSLTIIGNDNRGASAQVTLPEEGAQKDLTVTLSQQYILSGLITNSDGNPIPSAAITLFPVNNPKELLVLVSQSDGTYEIPYLEPGLYELIVYADGYDAFYKLDLSIAESTSFDVSLTKSDTILTGRLTDPQGHPIAHGEIAVVDQAGRYLGETKSSIDGSFHITTASGDNLSLQSHAPSYADKEQTGLRVERGSTVDIGPIVMEPIALCQFTGNLSPPAASLSGISASRVNNEIYDIKAVATAGGGGGGFFAALKKWAGIEFGDIYPKDRGHIGIPYLPPDTCRDECMDAYKKAEQAYQNQKAALSVVHGREEGITSQTFLSWSFGSVEIFSTAGDIAAVIVSGYEIAAAAEVTGAISALEAGETALAAKTIVEALVSAKGIGELISDLGRMYYDSASSPQKTTDILKSLVSNGSDLIFKGRSRMLKGNRARRFGGIAAGRDIFALLLDFDEHYKRWTLTETRNAAGELSSNMSLFDSAVKNYRKQVARAIKARAEYAKCLRDCAEKHPEAKEEAEEIIKRMFSRTPEDKFGPEGYITTEDTGENIRWVNTNQIFTYRVDFWNKPDAPVPTQDAVIIDTLDPNVFDLSTFQFTRIGFLKWDIPLPGGQALQTRIDMRPDMDLAVDVTGTFNPVTGEIRWWFHCIDPITGDYPEDPFVGFLPPYNPETGYEIGWVEFTVELKENLPDGAQISNQAFVEFDFAGDIMDHPAPKEGPWINTVDTIPPTSRVTALPSVIASPFTLEWTGEDEGSGVSSYSVYVSENEGTYQLLIDNTSLTSIVFEGEIDRVYSFYCRAKDNAGLMEPDKSDAEATTRVTEITSVMDWEIF